MSCTALIVLMYGSRSACLSRHALAKDRARWRLARSIAGVLGTESGRTGLKYPGLQSRAGLLLPTPRGSKPMTSYCAATSLGSVLATNPARVRPLPPGPPGLTSSGPWNFVAVCGTRESASVIFRPCGFAWSSGTLREAHWSVGYVVVPQFFQLSFGAEWGAEASAGTAVNDPAKTTAAPHSTAARFLIESSQDGGCADREGHGPRRIVPESPPGRTCSANT